MADGNGEGEGGGSSWMSFFLIYGVLNFFLYKCFGIVIIPIPGFRR